VAFRDLVADDRGAFADLADLDLDRELLLLPGAVVVGFGAQVQEEVSGGGQDPCGSGKDPAAGGGQLGEGFGDVLAVQRGVDLLS
jgi:hypothetical protein